MPELSLVKVKHSKYYSDSQTLETIHSYFIIWPFHSCVSCWSVFAVFDSVHLIMNPIIITYIIGKFLIVFCPGDTWMIVAT